MSLHPFFRLTTLAILSVILFTGTVYAQTQHFSGSLDDSRPEATYTFTLAAGESVVIRADAADSYFDTVLTLNDPNGKTVSYNDDRNAFSLDPALGYTAVTTGEYTITIRRYSFDDSGAYELTIETGDETVLRQLKALNKVAFSGPERIIDTDHFRIHFTLEGNDSTTIDYAQAVADTMEEIWQIQIDRIGWPAPPNDGDNGGNSRLDVYVMDLMDAEGYGPLGTTKGIGDAGDNPNTTAVEQYAVSSVMRIENDFSESSQADRDPITLMRATAAHEFHHAIQHGYDLGDQFLWYHEATSTWMETITFPKEEDATVYVEFNYEYPELCLGTANPEYSQLMYGDWMFMQSLVDVYGSGIIQRLWERIAADEGFDALAKTLSEHGDTIPAAVARYRIQNLVRDYKFAPDFGGATVWLEDRITAARQWDFNGVQELGANYVALTLPPGTYRVHLANDTSGMLEMWAVTIKHDQAASSYLGRDGVVAIGSTGYTYLIILNTAYDDDVSDCHFQPYTLDVRATTDTPAPIERIWDAQYFLPLK
ncbi:MAG: PPC domain-containing protein [Anaerolineaceae bacterium]|nr:PPC domain-containing protein [Anaerolineaceae bacterium]